MNPRWTGLAVCVNFKVYVFSTPKETKYSCDVGVFRRMHIESELSTRVIVSHLARTLPH
jgi:hypothetical protein